MPAPTEPARWRAGAAGLLLVALAAAAEPSAVPAGRNLRLDRTLERSSPFRLSINRSEYAVASTKPQAQTATANGTRAKPLTPLIDRHATRTGIDPALVHAVIQAESAYRPEAVSPKGAIGLMQVMPDTGRRFGVHDLAKPEENLRAGTAYLRFLLDRYDGNIPLALAAYNAGEGSVDRYGNAIPPYPETKAYVSGILRNYWGATVPGSPFRYSYLEGARLDGLDLSPYRLKNP